MSTGGDRQPGRTLYLVDGTSQLYRAYYAIRRLSNADGLPTNATYGFTTMLRKLLRDEQVQRIGVIFDPPGPVFRNEIYPDYKSHRPPIPVDLVVQIPWIKQICEALAVPAIEVAGFEADDLIATFAVKAQAADLNVVIVASDKDLLQLVRPGIELLHPAKNQHLDRDGVDAHFGVPPEQVRDVLALMGDAVDNIPGVPGIGEKTAIAAVRTYGDFESVLHRAGLMRDLFQARDLALAQSADGVGRLQRLRSALDALAAIEVNLDFRARLEALIATIDHGDPPAIRRQMKALDRGSSFRAWQAIAEHVDQARLSLELVTLHQDVPLPCAPEALRLGQSDRVRASALFSKLGFRGLTDEFAQAVVDEPVTESPARSDSIAAVPFGRYETVLETSRLADLVAECRREGRVAVDTETDSVDPLRARLVGIAIACRSGEASYIPVGHGYLGAPTQLRIEAVQEHLAPLFSDPALSMVGQNLKYDAHVLRRHGLPVAGWSLDTMVAAFLLDSDRAGYGLDGLVEECLGHRMIRFEELVGRGSKQLTIDRIEIERVTEYAAEDADATLRLAVLFERRLTESGLIEVYRKIDGPLLPLLIKMETWGIRVDAGRLGSMSAEFERTLGRIRTEICALAGVEFNVDSPKQLREVLFGKLGLKSRRRTAKSGDASTDARALDELSEEHLIASKLLEYREIAKLKGTYADALPRLIHPETGRVHTSFHPTGAATGRLSSSDPNLQNVPARTALGRRIREAFVPEAGFLFLASDYSQVELRILAHLSGDEALVAAFRANEDIHRLTAARVLGIPIERVSDEERQRAKAVNFGILYGMSETRLAREQGLSRVEAHEFIEAYFARFSGVKSYIERVREAAERDGSVRTLFGRIRHFPALGQGSGRALREQALRAAVNTTVQGTAADIMKLAMLEVDAELGRLGSRARVLLQVHDELLLEVPEDEVRTVGERVRVAMEGVVDLSVPLLVDQKIGRSWSETT